MYQGLVGYNTDIRTPPSGRALIVVGLAAERVPVRAGRWGIDAVTSFGNDGVRDVSSAIVGILRDRAPGVVRATFAGELMVARNESLLEHEGEDDHDREYRTECNEDCPSPLLAAIAACSSFFANLRAGHAASMLGAGGGYSVAWLVHELKILFHVGDVASQVLNVLPVSLSYADT